MEELGIEEYIIVGLNGGTFDNTRHYTKFFGSVT